ncbi:MAG: hypothetical protein HPY57_06695 [Ignavibacteria bacterium]|nr:hypothetical protein [Ignavibacteria bacterium]
MKKILFILFINTAVLLAQRDTIKSKIPEIELPDFVITGQATVELPRQNKATPDLIVPLSKEFILPRIKIQELRLEGLSDPSRQQPSIVDTSIKYSGRIKTAAGIYSLPEAEIFYYGRLRNILFAAGGNFENSRDYEKNSKYLKTNFFLNNSLIIQKEKEPPARLNVNGAFDYFKYSNFKSFSSDTFNNITNLNINGSLENLFYREFNLNFGGNFDYQKLSRWDFSFAEISAFGTLKSTFEHFELTASAHPYLYKVSKNLTENSLILSAYGELYFRKLFNVMNIVTRLDYQSEKENNSQFLAPSTRIGFGLSDYWTLTLFYENKLLNKTPINLWNENPYLDSASFNYSIERIKNKFGFGTIIYFDRSSNLKFELSRYNVAGKNVFIVDTTNTGYFKIQKLETETIELNTFLFVDLNRYGDLLLNLKYINSRLKLTTRQEPHNPAFQSKLSYGYRFAFPLYLRLSFLYNSVSYGDINHQIEIEPYTDIEFSADYQLVKFLNAGIELKNILNKKNYRWFNYQQKPIDFQIYLKARF